MKRIIAETSRVVHASEIDTLAKRGDLYERMQRKFEGRFGRTTPYYVEERPVRRACCFRSSANAYLVTLQLTDGEPWGEPASDGDRYNNHDWYEEQDQLREKRLQELLDRHDAERKAKAKNT